MRQPIAPGAMDNSNHERSSQFKSRLASKPRSMQRARQNCYENLMFSHFDRTASSVGLSRKNPRTIRAGSFQGSDSILTPSNRIDKSGPECNQVQDNNSKNKCKLATRGQPQLKSLPIFLATIVTLVCLQDAQLGSGFSYTQYPYNHGISGYNYPYQSPTLSPFNPNFWRPLYKRYVNDNDSSMMPSTMDSFTMDQSGSQAPAWASMLRGAPFQAQEDTLVTHTKNILIPRVSGTPGNVQVREYITNHLRSNGYQIELDEFVDRTPIGNVRFSNIIARSNPNACRQLSIACHYDSKMMAGFLGATDSAVPCAMMLKMAERFKDSFRETPSPNPKSDLGLMFVFFDGEEAFQEWTDTDSLYGSRHLAAKWEKQAAPQHCASAGYKNELARLDMMMVLDLIGAADTSFATYNRRLQKHYNNLKKYEREHLLRSGVGQSQLRNHIMFTSKYIPLHFLQDDHVPFMQRGVPILSLLAHPFPKVWHTINDNWDAIDFNKTRRVQYVLEEFVANYDKN